MVKRYSFNTELISNPDRRLVREQDPSGYYVTYQDYDNLQEELKTCQDLLKKEKQEYELLRRAYNSLDKDLYDTEQELITTRRELESSRRYAKSLEAVREELNKQVIEIAQDLDKAGQEIDKYVKFATGLMEDLNVEFKLQMKHFKVIARIISTNQEKYLVDK